MRNIHKYIFMFCITIFIVSCKKMITENPRGFINNKTLFNTQSGATAGLIGVYERISTYYYFGIGYAQFLSLGSGAFWTNHTASLPVARQQAQATDALVNNTWREAYSAINSVNGFIDGMIESPLAEQIKKPILGEGYFIRALLYFNNVRIWGAVPLRLHQATSSEIMMERTPVDKIYEQIINDLEQAKTLMPNPQDQTKGRPHKYAAFALLSKVYITMAGNEQTSPYWEKARNEAIAVYNSNAYSLVRPLKDLWDVNKENSQESIFEVQFNMAGGSSNGLTQTFMPSSILLPNQKTSPLGRIRLHKSTFDDHVNTYPGDPRINIWYLHTSYQSNSGATNRLYPDPLASASNGYPYILKYLDPAYIASVSNKNFVYMRYADLLLMLAEIENELNGPAGAYKYINEVLHRARDQNGNGNIDPGETLPSDWSGMAQAQFRERIMLERRIELIGEAHEFYDTRRRGEAYLKSYLEHHNQHPRFNVTNDWLFPTDDAAVKRLLLMPLPSDEINSNRLISPNDQNPGY